MRRQTVNLVFRQIKWNRDLHELLLRGLSASWACRRFEWVVHNLLKLRTAGLPSPGAPAPSAACHRSGHPPDCERAGLRPQA